NGALFGRRHKRQGEQKLVPGEHEHQNCGGRQSRRRQRQEYLPKPLERRAALKPRGPVKRVGNRSKKEGKDPKRTRKSEDGVGENQAAEGIAKPQASDDQEQGAHGRDRRKHGDDECHGEHREPADEFEFSHRERRRSTERDPTKRASHRDQEGVEDGSGEGALLEHGGIVGERERPIGRAKRMQEDPGQRRQAKAQYRRRREIDAYPLQRAAPRTRPRTLTYPKLIPTAARKMAIARVEP